jgi:RnfABCDGE-type electron transport complex B subunit
MVIVLAGGTMLVLAIGMTYVLGWANKKFHVEVDPRVAAIDAALPGANCGGCGCVGCSEYAEAVASGALPPNKCPVGGAGLAQTLADIMGVELEETWPYRPIVHCRSDYAGRLHRRTYVGEPTCTAANMVSGVQGCSYGCLGFGDCVRACDFDAIHVINGLAEVDYAACTGCGACARVCPRNIISMVPFKSEQMLAVACSNLDIGPDVKAVCKVGCIGCSGCAKRSVLFNMADNLAHIDYDAYDPEVMDDATQLAIEKCPMKGIVYVGKPTEKDLAKVEDEEAPELVKADFKTTVDDTEWWG